MENPGAYRAGPRKPAGRKENALFGTPIFLLLAFFIIVVLFLNKYRPVDVEEFILKTFWISMPLWVLHGTISLWLLKRVVSRKRMVALWVIAFFAYPTFTGAAGIWLNGFLDTSQPRHYRLTIQDKTKFKGRRSGRGYSHYVYTDSWREGHEREKVEVSSEQYDRVHPGRTEIRLKIREGWVGQPWIEGKKILPPGNGAADGRSEP